MKAVPIVPGHYYQVTGKGFDMAVPAGHPVDAILYVIDMIKHLERLP